MIARYVHILRYGDAQASKRHFPVQWIVYATMGTAVVTDICIAGTLYCYLRRHTCTGNERYASCASDIFDIKLNYVQDVEFAPVNNAIYYWHWSGDSVSIHSCSREHEDQ